MLALEEPETHLHPQAARTLWGHVRELPGQKIVTTRSPYFVQHVPFRDLRLVRLTKEGTQVKSLPASFSAAIPPLNGLDAVAAQSGRQLNYETASKILTVKGALDKRLYRALLQCCGGHEQRTELEGILKELRDRSSLHIRDDELQSLETYARRMRGEIFFAERWLIVEGQADYLILHALGNAMDYDLDSHGVSVIDAQNNGNPDIFAALARALDIPWLGVFDGDDAGKRYVEKIGKRGFSDEELKKRCRTHSAKDLEAQLLSDGLGPQLREILNELHVQDALDLEDEALVIALRDNKTAHAAALSAGFRTDANLVERAPPTFRTTIEQLRGLT